jgi:pimeloyl-ACP methyl ester carboxylesterase
MKNYNDVWYQSADGLKLYARDYNRESQSGMTVLCLHGLTRNSADFESIADVLSEQHRVISVDQRGRGLSQWDNDASHYAPPVYVQDMWALLDHLNIKSVLVLGTSLGGLMGMMMAAEKPDRIQGLIINDVGPEVAPEGLARIMSYVGKGKPVHSWDDAVEQTRFMNQSCFPDYTDEQWRAMAQRIYRENDQEVPVLAYDPAIAAPIEASEEAAVPPDLWPLFGLLKSVSVMAIRGALSDILSQDCFAKMQQVLPEMVAVEIPGVGHAPMLDEAESVKAIVNFMNKAVK